MGEHARPFLREVFRLDKRWITLIKPPGRLSLVSVGPGNKEEDFVRTPADLARFYGKVRSHIIYKPVAEKVQFGGVDFYSSKMSPVRSIRKSVGGMPISASTSSARPVAPTLEARRICSWARPVSESGRRSNFSIKGRRS